MPTTAQLNDNGTYHLHGIVVDAMNGEPIPGVAIVRKGTNYGTVSNYKGEFDLNIMWYDSLYFTALMYDNVSVKPPDSLFRDNDLVFRVPLESKSYLLNEVNIEADEQVPLELRSQVFKDKPNAIDYFFHPLSILYYHSKKEKRKRKLISIMEQEKIMTKFGHIYNRKTIAQISGLTDSQLDSCIIYCNANIELQISDNDNIVKWKMMRVISDFYRQENSNVPDNQ